MAFRDQLNSDLGDVFFNTDEFAVEVAYLAQGGQPQVTINVLIDFGADLDEFEKTRAKEAILQVKKSDVPNIKNRDKFYISGVWWHVFRVEFSDEHTTTVRIYRDERGLA